MAVCELDLSSWFTMIRHWMTRSTGIVGKGAPMANDLEKRSFTRHITQGVITLHTSLMTPHVINAHLLNCSKEGICFTSTKKFSTGTTMLYRSLYNNYSMRFSMKLQFMRNTQKSGQDPKGSAARLCEASLEPAERCA